MNAEGRSDWALFTLRSSCANVHRKVQHTVIVFLHIFSRRHFVCEIKQPLFSPCLSIVFVSNQSTKKPHNVCIDDDSP
jgi:hypothetical protein